MIVTIHQPEHLPYFGFIDKVNKADIFVILDDVQFKKNNFQNRNQILTPYGAKWISIPVEMKNIENKNINARIVKEDWKENYRNKIVENYKKYPYFEIGMKLIDNMLSVDSNLLIDYNIRYINDIFSLLDVNTNIIFSSSFNITTTKTQRLYDICKDLDATAYLAGQGAIDYLDENIFKSDIKLLKHNFTHPTYKQLNSKEFVPYMSSLDILMSVGIDRFRRFLENDI